MGEGVERDSIFERRERRRVQEVEQVPGDEEVVDGEREHFEKRLGQEDEREHLFRYRWESIYCRYTR